MRMIGKNQRGHVNHDWLNTYHTFSFASYYNPQMMNYRGLRVMNEDWIAAGRGFGEHPHEDMEIITYVISGALEHKDSMGNGEVLRAGEFQRMTAGTGITHSEFNPSRSEPVHLYQMWLFPQRAGLPPSYEQKRFDSDDSRNRLQLVASPENDGAGLALAADARLYFSHQDSTATLSHRLPDGRYGWLQVLQGGELQVTGNDGQTLTVNAGDGIALGAGEAIEVSANGDTQWLLYDLA